MKRGFRARNPWEDRFQTPGLDDLLGALAKPQLQLIDQAREGLLALEGVTESIAWLGIPWRWTLAFNLEGTAAEKPWIYLVPQPAKPLLALPMSSEMVQALPMRRLPKFIRDVIVLSPKVAGVHWMQWELSGRGQVDELVGLARRKHSAVLSPVA